MLDVVSSLLSISSHDVLLSCCYIFVLHGTSSNALRHVSILFSSHHPFGIIIGGFLVLFSSSSSLVFLCVLLRLIYQPGN